MITFKKYQNIYESSQGIANNYNYSQAERSVQSYQGLDKQVFTFPSLCNIGNNYESTWNLLRLSLCYDITPTHLESAFSTLQVSVTF